MTGGELLMYLINLILLLVAGLVVIGVTLKRDSIYLSLFLIIFFGVITLLFQNSIIPTVVIGFYFFGLLLDLGLVIIGVSRNDLYPYHLSGLLAAIIQL